MDWKDLAGTLIKTGAPIIGTALGGPLGGTIGGVAGRIIADALGVPATPEAVNRAIEADPAGASAALADADAKWQAMAEIARAEAADRTAQGQAINETIRAEVAAGVSWWHWRHLIGYVNLLWFVVPLPAFVRLTFSYNAEAVTQLTTLIGACVPLYGFMAALNGYIAQDNTKLKTVAITGEQPQTATGSIVSAVKSVVKPTPKIIPKPVGSRD